MALSDELEQRVDDLAGEYVARVNGGEDTNLDDLAAQLPSEEARTALRDLVDDTRRLLGLLPAQVRAGTLLAKRYRIGDELGSGGMGKVFAARDEELGRDVAVKVLASFGNERIDPREQFRREAQLQASFRHDNVVTIHERAQDDDVHFIVMDRVPGTAIDAVVKTARQRRSEGRSGKLLEEAIGYTTPDGDVCLIDASWWRSVGRIVAQAARALEAAHAQGLVHRDIKPQNIMLRGGGQPMLLDFGLAGQNARTDAGEVTRGLFGSAAYLAPEQVKSQAVGLDVRTDVYQLGTVLYELLTLERAFPGSNVSSILDRIERGDLRAPRAVDSSIPAHLEAICLRALEHDPLRRYASMHELREDIERYLRDERPVAAKGGRTSRILWRARREARRPGALVAAAALMLASVFAWQAWKAPAEIVHASPLSVPSEGVVVQALRFDPNADTRQSLAAAGPDTSAVSGILSYAIEKTYGDVDLAEDIDTLSLFDGLGAEIATAEDATVHALSVFTRGNDAYAMAVPVEFLGREVRGAGPYSLRIPGNQVSRVVCSHVIDANNETKEGLYIFVTSDEELSDRVHDWIARVNRMARAVDPDGAAVPLTAALALLGDKTAVEIVHDQDIPLLGERSALAELRGGALRPITDQQRRAIEELIESARQVSDLLEVDSFPPFTGIDVFGRIFEVSPSR